MQKKMNYPKKTMKIKTFLIDSMEKKKLQRIKDVTYDINKNTITNIHGLTYNTKKDLH